jgi:serine/threonine-protein kinase
VDKIGKYKIIDTIGKGGMGVVYKAQDPRIGRIVAIKTLFAHRDVEPETRHRFLQEARSAGALSHKNIITIYEMDEDAGLAFIAMEYLEGEDLRAVISRRAPVPLEQKLHILTEICEGMAHAHAAGVIHRDIKPGNIFITRTGQVKILDFGLARVTSSEHTLTGTSMGTPSYMSPEQVRGEKLDHRTDIFSLGVVAYELITYVKPFHAETDIATAYKVSHSEPEPVEKVEPRIPIELSSVIAGALEKDPNKRYQQADDLLREFEAVKGLLEERRRVLREEVRAAVAKLTELVRANKNMVEDVAEKLAAMKQAAPEFFDGTIPAQTGDLAPRRRTLQLDYLALIELRDRALHECDRVAALLEKRQRTTYLLREVDDLEHDHQLESALKILEFILREDPTYTVAAKLKEELTTRLQEQQREQERARRVAELLVQARSLFAAQEWKRCLECLDGLLKLEPDRAEALALQADTQKKILEQKKLEMRRRRAESRLAEARKALSGGSFQKALTDLEDALAEWPEMTGAADLRAQIEAAEQEAEAKAAREREVRGLMSEAAALERSGNDDEALGRLGQLLKLEPNHAAALELQSVIDSRRTKRQRANDLFQQAAASFSGNDLARAQSLLLQALELEPAHAEARDLLEQVGRRIEEQELREKQRRQALDALERARRSLSARSISAARKELDLALKTCPDIEGAAALAEEIDRSEEQERLRKEKEQKIRDLLAQAEAWQSAGASEEALPLLAQVLELQPGHRQAVELKRDIEAGRRAAELAAQKRREKIASALRRAREAAEHSDFEKAINLARSIAAGPDADDEVEELVASWEAELERRREAEEANRRKVIQLLDSARALMSARAFVEARKALQEALAVKADHPEALGLLRQAQAEIDAEKTRQARAQEGQEQKQSGLRLLMDKKYRESLAALKRAAELVGEDSSIRLAIQEAEAEIRADEVRTQVQSSLVEAHRLFVSESYNAAQASVLKALGLAPDHAEARELLAKIESALEHQRTRARVVELLTQARQAMGQRDFKTASRLVSEILVLDDQNAEAREVLNKIDEAQQEKSRRVEIAALLAQSSQALAAGDFNEAAIHAREVLLIDGQNADARKLLQRIDESQQARHRQDRLAALLLQSRQERSRRDLDAALTHIQELLRLDPAHKEARALLKELEKDIRGRQKEQERERKRAAQEQHAKVAAPAADATLILAREKGALAWMRTPWAIGLAVIILAGVVYAVLQSGGGTAEVAVLSDPDGVEILLDNRPVGTTSAGRLLLVGLPAGKVTLVARKNGFTPSTREITLLKGRNRELALKLAPLLAEMRIRVDQPDVRIQLDGSEIGKTSAAGSTVSLQVQGGKHTVSLIKEGFEVLKRETSFTPGETILVYENLRPLAVKTNVAVLRILSNPPDADVYLDGKLLGATAGGSLVLQDLKPGPARLVLRKNGYGDYERNLTLEAGKAIDQVVALSAKAATLILATNAPGAEVLVDNVSKGKTNASGNLTLEGLLPESRILKIVKEGYQDKLDLLALKPGETKKLQVTLAAVAARPAVLSVSSLPEKAEVYIDDEYKGSTPLNDVKLEPGTRKIKIKKEGYREVERSVDLRAGEAKAEPFNLDRMRGTLQFTLQPEGVIAKIGAQPYDTAKQKQIELEAGTYTIELTAAGYKPLQKTITIEDRQTTRLQAVLEALMTTTTTSYTDAFLNLDSWEHPPGWQADNLMQASGAGTAILKGRAYENFRQNFQLRLKNGVKASWFIRWQDDRNYCLVQINSDRSTDRARRNTIYFSVYREGQQTAVYPVPLPFPFGRSKADWVDIQMEVVGNQIIAKGSIVTGTTTTGSELGRYTIQGLPARGRVGFAIFDDEEFDVSGFVIEPIR